MKAANEMAWTLSLSDGSLTENSADQEDVLVLPQTLLKQFNRRQFIYNDDLAIVGEHIDNTRAHLYSYRIEYIPLPELISQHNATANALEIFDMGQYGFGVRSHIGSSMLTPHNYLVYAGVYQEKQPVLRQDRQQHRHDIEVFGFKHELIRGIKANGSLTNGLSKYVQHLPTTREISSEPYLQNKPIATANMQILYRYTCIAWQAEKFIIPIVILAVTDTVYPQQMVGFSYGNGYWDDFAMSPAYFSQDGHPMVELAQLTIPIHKQDEANFKATVQQTVDKKNIEFILDFAYLKATEEACIIYSAAALEKLGETYGKLGVVGCNGLVLPVCMLTESQKP